MLLFYIRHGDPIYNPDSLTPLGHKQAEAVAKRLALFGVDRIYSSTSTRAVQTAQPICDLLKKEAELLDFCHENYAWKDFSVTDKNGKTTWPQNNDEFRQLFASDEIRKLGNQWYEHPAFKDHNFKSGSKRIHDEADKLLYSWGYEYISEEGRFKVIKSNNDRIALFAHAGFGSIFLSYLLNIPYPQFSIHFSMCHSGMTVLEFKEKNGYTIPKVLIYSGDSHLYREGLPLNYNNRLRF
ncbi:MAG: histidine phosphatase family protein [Clostridiales bacterium]|nr:histidine phosphatase family protein [Clostridiales bacterium]